jgi:hypothetical protein
VFFILRPRQNIAKDVNIEKKERKNEGTHWQKRETLLSLVVVYQHQYIKPHDGFLFSHNE